MTEDTILEEFIKVMEFMANQPILTHEEIIEHRHILCESMSAFMSSLPSGEVTSAPSVSHNHTE